MAPKTTAGLAPAEYPVWGSGQIGGNGGSPFWSHVWNASQNQIAVVRRLKVFWDGGALRSIQLWYSDGTVQGPFGNSVGDNATIEFQPGERVTDLTLWGNGVGTRCGRISINTSMGRHFEHGKDVSGQQGYSMSVHSGFLMGAYGNSGADLDNLGLLFLAHEVKNVDITNVTYDPPLVGTSNGIRIVTIDLVLYTNDDTVPASSDFHGSKERIVVHSWESSSTTTWGVNAKIVLTVPILGLTGSSKTGFHWEKSSTQTVGGSIEEPISLRWDAKVEVPARSKVVAEAVVGQGTGDVSFSGDVKLTLTDGNSFTYRDTTGRYQNVVFSLAEVQTKPASSFASGDVIGEFRKPKLTQPKHGKSHGH